MLRSRSLLAGFAFLLALSVAPSHAAPASSTDPTDATVAVTAAGNTDAGVETELARPSNESSVSHSQETDDHLVRADRHFNSGRQLYFQGNLEGARKEFDTAVDTLLDAPDSVPDHNRIERRLDEICDLIYRFDVEKLGAGQKEDQDVVFDKAPIDEISHMTFPVDPNLAPKLQTELNQTSSGIPLELSDPVLGFVHYFSSDRGRKILLAGFRRAGRYRTLIERIFAEEGVPQELVYLAQAESGFLPRAVSNKAARGMWQFIAGTGNDYNLAHTSTFDERFDPEKATRAAARLLKDLHARYGDWYLAMAAYNCGAGAVDRAVERTGYADYWELLKRHALPKETANYVPIIIAMTIMAKNPNDYGLSNIETDPAEEYDSIKLTASTNLNLIADAAMQPVSVIRDLNPALLKTVAPSGFNIHVPKGAASITETALESVPPQNRQAWRLHHVESGDTLTAIARSYHLSAERIVAVNRGAESLEAGDVLLIPAAYHEDTTASRSRQRSTRAKGVATSLRSTRSTVAQRGTSSRQVGTQVLHRKAAVRTASLER